ncbi:MAG: TldD/PmbA family protein [Syntrophorhabdaceae bacterium]
MNDITGKIAGAFEQYELFYVNEKSKKIEARDGEICSAEHKEEEGYALRAISDSRQVFTYTYDRVTPAEKLLDNAKALLPVIEKDEACLFAAAGGPYPTNRFHDPSGLSIPDEVKRSNLLEMEKAIREYDPRIKAVRNCEFQESEASAALWNSNSIAAQGDTTLFVYSAMAVAGEGGDEVSWYDWRWSHNFTELGARQMGIEIADKVISMLFAQQIPTGTYEGIFTPRAASDLLGVLSESFLAESLYKDKTHLKGKEGSMCFSDQLTIRDSGMAGTDAFPFDGEGVPSLDNAVVENGVFRTFLYDTYFGAKLGKHSTANSVRSGLKSPPRCGIRGMYIEKGSRDINGFLTNGIVVEELMGTHTANSITGDFSVGCLGYRVQNGTKQPFQGVMISGNVFDIFKNIKETGTDLTFYGSVGTPSLYIEGLKISGT